MTEFLSRLTNFGSALPSVVSLGLIWGIMAIGLYITYKVLELSDLTVDGSFCTGCAVCIVMMSMGYPTWLGMLCAFIAGLLAGAVTGFLHTVCKIPAILSGILTQLGLWTVNMIIMGMQMSHESGIWVGFEKVLDGESGATVVMNKYIKIGELVSTLTIPARNSKPLVSALYLTKALDGSKPFFLYPPLVMLLITVVVIIALYWFFGTERGASIRATGANEHMARAQGINTNVNKLIGLMLANGLVALSGSLFAQFNGNAEINMGRGAIVIGLAAIIIGDVLFSKIFKNFAMKLAAVSIGAIIYYIVIQAVLTLLKVDSQYLKLMSAVIVAIFLTVPNLKRHHKKKTKKAEVATCSR